MMLYSRDKYESLQKIIVPNRGDKSTKKFMKHCDSYSVNKLGSYSVLYYRMPFILDFIDSIYILTLIKTL